jgi:hypothetical protein
MTTKAPLTLQPAFQPVDGGQIEMVGRLVEQQQIGLAGQSATDRGTAPLTAAGAGGIARQVDAKLVGDGPTSWRGGASARAGSNPSASRSR